MNYSIPLFISSPLLLAQTGGHNTVCTRDKNIICFYLYASLFKCSDMNYIFVYLTRNRCFHVDSCNPATDSPVYLYVHAHMHTRFVPICSAARNNSNMYNS